MYYSKKRIIMKTVAVAASAALLACQLGVSKASNIFADKTEANATILYSDDYDEFLNALGQAESGNDYTLSGRGYYGRWMIGRAGLQEAGLMTAGGAWTSLAASYGVYNATDFCNSEACQDYAVLVLQRRNWEYLKSNGAASHVGETYKGVKVTVAGLTAAAHLAGAWGAASMFKGNNVVDGNGVSAFSYMKRFGGYDIEKTITGVDTAVHDATSPSTTAAQETVTTNVDVAPSTDASTQSTPAFTVDAATVKQYGDVNGDSIVDSSDATQILIFYAEKLLDDSLTFDDYLNSNKGENSSENTSEDASEDVSESIDATESTESTEIASESASDESAADASNTGDSNVDVNANQAASGDESSTGDTVDTSESDSSSEESSQETENTENTESTETTEYVQGLGDVNGDGVIDSSDATVILIYYAEVLLNGEPAATPTEDASETPSENSENESASDDVNATEAVSNDIQQPTTAIDNSTVIQ